MSRPRLLIADGDRMFTHALAGLAESLGFTAAVVSDGAGLQACFDSFAPDVLAFEVFLQEVDGLEMIAWLGDRGWQSPTLIFTGRGPQYLRAAEGILALHGLDFAEVFQKPLDRSRVGAALEQAVRAIQSPIERGGAPAGALERAP